MSQGLASSMGDVSAQREGGARPLPAYPLGPPAGSPEAAAAAAAEVGALMRSSGRGLQHTAATPEPAQLTPRSGDPPSQRERKEELSAVSAAAAQAAWRSAGELRPAHAKRPPQMLPPAPARLSAKLDEAGGADLAGGGLREDLEQALGGAGNVARLEAAARPGCVHLVTDVRLLQVGKSLLCHSLPAPWHSLTCCQHLYTAVALCCLQLCFECISLSQAAPGMRRPTDLRYSPCRVLLGTARRQWRRQCAH